MKLEKYLVNIEFRYTSIDKNYDDTIKKRYNNKEITIGVYDDIEDAIKNGNAVLELLESKFKLNPYHNKKERFSNKEDLVSELAYLKTPFSFFARIIKLKYTDNLSEIIDNITKQAIEYKKQR